MIGAIVAPCSTPPTKPEIDLWCAVLALAWTDATAELPTARGSTTKARQPERDEARRFFARTDPGFEAIVLAAGLDPDVVRSRYRAQVVLEETLDRARAA